MKEIEWPKATNPEVKINLVADKVNEVVRAVNALPHFSCQHTGATQLKNGAWYCPDCRKFVKAPQ